jgi:hypothetical protein
MHIQHQDDEPLVMSARKRERGHHNSHKDLWISSVPARCLSPEVTRTDRRSYSGRGILAFQAAQLLQQA